MRMLVLLVLVQPLWLLAQETTFQEQQLENQAERDEVNTEDDTYWQQLHHYQKHQLNLNEATEEDLHSLQLLSTLQITHFFKYRQLLGRLIDIYEVQAIPGWDVATIHRLLPYVTVNNNQISTARFKNGEQKLLIRSSLVPEPSKGYKTNSYPGSPLGMLFRYTYKFKNLLQYGITSEKDPGEKAIDFFSFHFFARQLGPIKSIALGDYTVKLGQGLIQWQGPGLKKGAGILFVKRQGQVLQPYNSAGEFNFYRGAGVTCQKKNIELTIFGSIRKLSATADSAITSLITTGYHRTESERAKRNNIQLISTGGALQWHSSNAHIGLNAIYHRFSHPLQPNNEPYDIFGAAGNQHINFSIDYGYTHYNIHFFGEMASDQKYNIAQLHGLLASLDPKIDLALLHRSISPRYQSLFSNAFTENTMPVNETGWYTGLSIRPVHGLQIDAYADIFRFPWLKYQVNTPSHGQEYLLQLTYTPNKSAELSSRFRHETKANIPRKNWRTQLTYTINRKLTSRTRLEAVWYGAKPEQETGFLFFQDIKYKPAYSPWSFSIRLQYMETASYNSRIYALENLVLYNMSAPAFFNKGLRYFINTGWRIKKRRQIDYMFSFAFAQTVYPSKTTIGSGNDAIEAEKRSEIKLQLIMTRK